MLVINANNIDLVLRIASIEMACRAMPQTEIDLGANQIREMVANKELSKEIALACVRSADCDDLGAIEDMSVLERLASVTNPAYAVCWYERRHEWPRLLYASPDNPEILQRILGALPEKVALRLELPTAQYLAAQVPWIDIAVNSTVTGTTPINPPVFSPTNPTLTYWRSVLTRPVLDKAYEKTGWDYFDVSSHRCIYTHTTDSETRLMLMNNDKPLPVVVARGRWNTNNIEEIYRKIDAAEDRDALLLVLYERVARLYGPDALLTQQVKSRLKYNRLFTPDKMLKFYETEWYPSIPAIHHYLLDADDKDIAHLIDINFHANIGIYDAVSVCTPVALRRLCIAALRWVLLYTPEQHATIRNLLNILAHYTHRVPWSTTDAAVCHQAMENNYTKELLLMFILTSTYPRAYKERYVEYNVQ